VEEGSVRAREQLAFPPSSASASAEVVPLRERRSRGVPGALLAWISRGLDRLADRVVVARRGEWMLVSFGVYSGLGAFVAQALMGLVLVGQGFSPLLFVAMTWGGVLLIIFISWILVPVFDARLRDPSQTLRRPVFVSWGGLLTLAVGLPALGWLSGFSALLLLDAVPRSGSLGQAIGRLGCLAYGCCFGRPTRGHLAITYRSPDAKAVREGGLQGVPLHPAGLYEAALLVCLFLGSNLAASHGVPIGTPLAAGSIFYGGSRFLVECFRDNEGRMVRGPLSANHLAALGFVLFGVLSLPIVLLYSPPTPAIDWARALAAAPWMIPALTVPSLVILLAFSLQRGRIGAW
jgi:prolipoprotein diacylglyceryltransferase